MKKAINATCLMLCLFPALVFAGDQSFVVPNNGTIYGIAARNEITRISFDEAVEEINSIEEELQAKPSGNSLYLRVNSDKPVNFFVITEKQRTYKFILSPEDVPATQLFVKNQDDSPKTRHPNKETKAISYQDHISEGLKIRISKIINVALRPVNFLGYQIQKSDKQVSSKIPGLNQRQVGKITGDRLEATKYILSSQAEISLALNDFITKDVLCVYLSKTALMPGEKSILITIKEKN